MGPQYDAFLSSPLQRPRHSQAEQITQPSCCAVGHLGCTGLSGDMKQGTDSKGPLEKQLSALYKQLAQRLGTVTQQALTQPCDEKTAHVSLKLAKSVSEALIVLSPKGQSNEICSK